MAEPGPVRSTSRRVAVTRSVDDNHSLAAALAGHGLEVVAVPLIEVVTAGDGGRALRAALDRLDRHRWLVLTSANGARAVAVARDGAPWPPAVAVAAVGPTTADVARAAGLPVTLVPDEATATALVDAFPPAPAPAPATAPDGEPGRPSVLAPLAELAGPTIEDGLAAKGWAVERVEAYRTTIPAAGNGTEADTGDGPDPGPVDVVTFFSPSAVDRWVDRFGVAGSAAVCIGPSTAARAEGRGFETVVTARPHTESAVVEAVVRALDLAEPSA